MLRCGIRICNTGSDAVGETVAAAAAGVVDSSQRLSGGSQCAPAGSQDRRAVRQPNPFPRRFRMRKLFALALFGAATVVAAPVFAADAPTPQQQKMKDCNAKAGDKKGDERKAFMSSCLSSKEAPAAAMTQQDKMKDCNVKAGDKKGDERKAFMSSCLKG
jgi:hypothetical protein